MAECCLVADLLAGLCGGPAAIGTAFGFCSGGREFCRGVFVCVCALAAGGGCTRGCAALGSWFLDALPFSIHVGRCISSLYFGLEPGVRSCDWFLSIYGVVLDRDRYCGRCSSLSKYPFFLDDDRPRASPYVVSSLSRVARSLNIAIISGINTVVG